MCIKGLKCTTIKKYKNHKKKYIKIKNLSKKTPHGEYAYNFLRHLCILTKFVMNCMFVLYDYFLSIMHVCLYCGLYLCTLLYRYAVTVALVKF